MFLNTTKSSGLIISLKFYRIFLSKETPATYPEALPLEIFYFEMELINVKGFIDTNIQ